jgi:hypothetical protein
MAQWVRRPRTDGGESIQIKWRMDGRYQSETSPILGWRPSFGRRWSWPAPGVHIRRVGRESLVEITFTLKQDITHNPLLPACPSCRRSMWRLGSG